MKFETDSELLKAVNDYLASLTKVVDTNRKAIQAVVDTSREALYNNLARGYELCLAMRDPDNATPVTELLETRRIKAATGNENPFLPLVRAIYGKLDDPADTNAAWIPNRSAEKYANVFRLAQQRNVKVEGFGEWLLGFKDDTHGKGLTAAVKRDRAENGVNDPAREAKVDRDIKVVLANKPIGTLKLPRDAADEKAKYVCVWGTFDGKQFTARGVLPDMSNHVERYLRKEAEALAEDIAKDRIIADAKAKRESAATQQEAVPA